MTFNGFLRPREHSQEPLFTRYAASTGHFLGVLLRRTQHGSHVSNKLILCVTIIPLPRHMLRHIHCLYVISSTISFFITHHHRHYYHHPLPSSATIIHYHHHPLPSSSVTIIIRHHHHPYPFSRSFGVGSSCRKCGEVVVDDMGRRVEGGRASRSDARSVPAVSVEPRRSPRLRGRSSTVRERQAPKDKRILTFLFV